MKFSEVRRGLTLLEILVVVAAVSLLLGLVIAGLQRTAIVRDDLINLTNLRSTHGDFLAWANDHDSYFPHPSPKPGERLGTPRYLGIEQNWPFLFSEWAGEPQAYWHSTAGPSDFGTTTVAIMLEHGARDGIYRLPSKFVYSVTCITTPKAWTFPGAGFSLDTVIGFAAPQRIDDVAHAAGKGLLLHRDGKVPGRWHAAFVDGSASITFEHDLQLAAARPWINPDTRGLPVLHTLNGVHGTDR